jgi:hypothetical protein
MYSGQQKDEYHSIVVKQNTRKLGGTLISILLMFLIHNLHTLNSLEYDLEREITLTTEMLLKD